MPLRLFVPCGGRSSRYISDCVVHYRHDLVAKNLLLEAAEMPDPIAYKTDDDIVHYVAEWVKDHREKLSNIDRHRSHNILPRGVDRVEIVEHPIKINSGW